MEENKETKNSGYILSRQYWDFAFENPDKVSASHAGFFFWLIELNNRLGWKQNFGLPTVHTMESLGISSYNTFRKLLYDLEAWGFLKFVEKSKNQHTSNIIALLNFDKAPDKALDKAMQKHVTPQNDIDKQVNKETINKETSQLFSRDYTPTNDFESLAFRLWNQANSYMITKGIKPTTLHKANPAIWSNDIRLMIEKDGRTFEEVQALLTWLPGCGFWEQNILSPSSLRKQFEKLQLDMRKPTTAKVPTGAAGRVSKFNSSLTLNGHGTN